VSKIKIIRNMSYSLFVKTYLKNHWNNFGIIRVPFSKNWNNEIFSPILFVW